jgi:DNA-binding NarL/FixJ family response regulator
MPIAVAIVEDNKDLRVGTEYVLKSSPAFEVVGAFENAEDLIYRFDDIKPEVVLMDIELPGISGIEATSILKKEHQHLQIVILSVFEDDENVFQAICAGACGYISKPVMPNQIAEVVEQAFSGASPMSPHIARKVLEMFKQHLPPPRADYNLTAREVEVLDMLIQGYDNKMIAEKMFLSAYTIRAHIRNIYEKLHVHSKSQAVAKALKERLVNKK